MSKVAKHYLKWYSSVLVAIVGLGVSVTVVANTSSGSGLEFAAFANYGFGGVMTAALGYAIWGLYRAHSEERKTWLDKWEIHFNKLLETLRESDQARHELANEVREHMREHTDMNEDIKKTLDRMASAIDANHSKGN